MRTSVERLTCPGFATCESHLKGRRAVVTRFSILAVVALLCMLPAMSFAQTATNNFNDGTGHDVKIPMNQYAGLTMSNAVWTTFSSSYTLGVDAGVAGGGNNWAFPGTASPIEILFDSLVNSVSITAIDVGDNGAQLEAFSGGTSVGTDNAVASPGPITTDLTVSAASIDRIELSQHLYPAGAGDGVVFDDLIYTLVAGVSLTLTGLTVTENQASGTQVGFFTTANTNGTFTYSLVSGTGDSGNGNFQISDSNLLTTVVFDYEAQTSYSVRVQSTEVGGGGLELTNTFTITIVNEVETWGGVYALAEVTAGQTAVATLQSLPGENTSVAYSKVTGFDSADFSIAGDALSLNAPGVLGEEKYIEVQAVGTPVGQTNTVLVKVTVVADATSTTIIMFD